MNGPDARSFFLAGLVLERLLLDADRELSNFRDEFGRGRSPLQNQLVYRAQELRRAAEIIKAVEPTLKEREVVEFQRRAFENTANALLTYAERGDTGIVVTQVYDALQQVRNLSNALAREIQAFREERGQKAGEFALTPPR